MQLGEKIENSNISNNKKYRLVTRSDFDGLVCALLFRELNMINEIKFVHPKDMQDGKIEITPNDITTNLPYVPTAYLVFDHHLSETIRNTEIKPNHIIDPNAKSAARVVYNYYGGEKSFPHVSKEILEAVDKADSADFTKEEILNPKGWILLNFIMDPRTGLGRFHNFRISNYQLMMELIDCCRTMTIDQILNHPDVKERIDLYFEHQDKAIKQIKRCSKVIKNLVVLDLRNENPIWPTNRFMIYALYPEVNISIHILQGYKNQNTVFAVGKSIINRSSKVNIGALMLRYNGGGHENAGTCQIDHDKAEQVMNELIEFITKY